MDAANLLLTITGDASEARRALEQTTDDVRDLDRERAEVTVEVAAEKARADLKRVRKELAQFDSASASAEVRAAVAGALAELKLVEREIKAIDRMDASVDVDVRKGALEQAASAIQGLSAQVADFDRQRAEAQLGVDAGRAKFGLLDLLGDVSSFDAQRAEAELDVASQNARAEVRALTRELRAVDSTTVSAEVNAQITDALVQLRVIERQVQSIDRMDATVDIDVRRGGIESAIAALGGLSRSVSGLVPSLGQAGQAATDAGGGFLSLGTQGVAVGGMFAKLGPAAAILVAAVAAVAAVATSVVAAVSAMVASLGAAVAGLGALGTAALGALLPLGALAAGAVKRFGEMKNQAGSAANALQGAFKGLGGAFTRAIGPAADAAMRGLATGLRAIVPMVAGLRGAFTGLGGAAGRALGLLGQAFAGMGPQIRQLIAGTSRLVGPIAQGVAALARIFLNIANGAMPFLVRGAQAVASTLQRWAAGTANASRLREVIGGLVGHLGSWLRLGSAIANVVLGFFKAAAPAGQQLVGALTRGAEALARWITSAEGTQAIRQFFDQVVPLATAFGGAVIALIPPFLRFVQTVAPLLTTLFNGMKRFFDFIGPAVAPAVAALTFLISPLDAIQGLIGTLTGKQVELGSVVSTVWNAIKTVISTVAGWFATGASALFGAGVAVIKGLWEGLKGAASAVWGAIKTVVSGAVKGAVSVVKTVWQGAKTVVTTIWGAIKTAASTVWGAIKTAVSTAVQAAVSVVKTVWNGAKTAVTAVWNALKTAASTVWNGIKSVVGGAVRGAVNLVKSLWSDAREKLSMIWLGAKVVASRVWNAIKEAIGSAVRGAVNVAKRVFNRLKAVLSGIWSSIRTTAMNAWNRLKNVIGDAVSGAVRVVRNLVSDFFSAGKALGQGLIDGIKSMAGGVADAVKGVAGGAKRVLPFSEPKDPSSPLRGLADSGRALVENFTKGIVGAGPLAARALAAELSGVRVAADVAGVATPPPAGGDTYHLNGPWASGYGGSSDARQAVAALELLLRQKGGLKPA